MAVYIYIYIHVYVYIYIYIHMDPLGVLDFEIPAVVGLAGLGV